MFISDVIGMNCLYSGVADAASCCILGIEPYSNCLMCSYDGLSGEVCFPVGAYSVQAGFRTHSVYWGLFPRG